MKLRYFAFAWQSAALTVTVVFLRISCASLNFKQLQLFFTVKVCVLRKRSLVKLSLNNNHCNGILTFDLSF